MPKKSTSIAAGTDALSMAIAQVRKEFGETSVMELGEGIRISDIDAISSGSLGLDIAMGIGGYPRGRIVELFGPESSGKTTAALHMVKNAQDLGGKVLFIDAEHSLDVNYAARLGVNVEELLVCQPDTGEQALNIVERLVKSGGLTAVVVDSVSALIPRAEFEGEIGDSHVGLQARLMSQAMRKLVAPAKKANCLILFVNQIREKIGVMFGNPEVTSGGRALKFYASVRLDIRRIGSIKDGLTEIGNRTKVKVVKNKVAVPFRIAEFNIIFNEGISRVGEILDFALEFGIIEKAGAWYKYDGNPIGQGMFNTIVALKENNELREEVEAQVLLELQPVLP